MSQTITENEFREYIARENNQDKEELQHFMNCRLGDSCARCQRFTRGFKK